MKKNLIILCALIAGCTDPKIEHVSTTELAPWIEQQTVENAPSSNSPDVVINTQLTLHEIEGFGTCFNELGWTSLQRLNETDREAIMKELFDPGAGANFTICRMPVAANDFARNWYSYNETEGDFDMANFSIANDQETLIPFIKNALQYNPNLKLWASPWSPPQWMKYNKHYAAKSLLPTSGFQSDEWGIDQRGLGNGLPPEREGKEGTNMFIQENEYFEAYALYFQKFIRSYRAEGIDISMVMPQNEFNSAQVFPSCTWTAAGLAKFVGEYLGPAMQEIDVDIMFGTMERPNEALVDTILTDDQAKEYVKGVGFQWAGKESIAGIHARYPNLPLYQTEQECGNGQNDWANTVYSWNLVKHYLTSGANAYLYWNTSLDEGGISTWGWKQNSLVTVDTTNNTYKFNHEYYLLKHLSHYVQPGAKMIQTSGSFSNLMAFKNPDSSIIVVAYNEDNLVKNLTMKVDGKFIAAELLPDSFSTIKLE